MTIFEGKKMRENWYSYDTRNRKILRFRFVLYLWKYFCIVRKRYVSFCHYSYVHDYDFSFIYCHTSERLLCEISWSYKRFDFRRVRHGFSTYFLSVTQSPRVGFHFKCARGGSLQEWTDVDSMMVLIFLCLTVDVVLRAVLKYVCSVFNVVWLSVFWVRDRSIWTTYFVCVCLVADCIRRDPSRDQSS